MDYFLFSQTNPVKGFFIFLTSLDTGIFNGVNNLAGKYLWLDTLAIFFARYFEFVLIFCLLLFLVKKFKKYWPMVVQTFLAAILARLVIVNFIRWLWPRARPFVENHVNLLLNYNPAAASFPSGHAAFFFAIATVVYFYLKKVYPHTKFGVGAGILFFVGAFLISLARVFVGIHWPSDIIAGALVGVFSGWFVFKLFKKLR